MTSDFEHQYSHHRAMGLAKESVLSKANISTLRNLFVCISDNLSVLLMDISCLGVKEHEAKRSERILSK